MKPRQVFPDAVFFTFANGNSFTPQNMRLTEQSPAHESPKDELPHAVHPY